MARVTDTERGAWMARDQAQAVLAAASRFDLFPRSLNRHERRLWEAVLLAAESEAEEQLFMRVELRRLEDGICPGVAPLDIGFG